MIILFLALPFLHCQFVPPSQEDISLHEQLIILAVLSLLNFLIKAYMKEIKQVTEYHPARAVMFTSTGNMHSYTKKLKSRVETGAL